MRNKDLISNRDKKLEPRSGKFWCKKCDMCLTYENTKCKNCGSKNRKRK